MPRNLKPAQPSPLVPSLAPVHDNLLKILEDIGDCKRCRLHEGRNRLGSLDWGRQARLVFVGEGPGADEDAQVGCRLRRPGFGQLLTQMIEGTAHKEGIPLQRATFTSATWSGVARGRESNATMDEMEICGQFLFRQLLATCPKAICALGSTAAKALLGTKEGVTRLRGKWQTVAGYPGDGYVSSLIFASAVQSKRYKKEAWEDLKKRCTMFTTSGAGDHGWQDLISRALYHL